MKRFGHAALLIALALELPPSAGAGDAIMLQQPTGVTTAARLGNGQLLRTVAGHADPPIALPSPPLPGPLVETPESPELRKQPEAVSPTPQQEPTIAPPAKRHRDTRERTPWISVETTWEKKPDSGMRRNHGMAVATDRGVIQQGFPKGDAGAVIVSDVPTPPDAPPSALRYVAQVPETLSVPEPYEESVACDGCCEDSCDSCCGNVSCERCRRRPCLACARWLFTTGATPCDDLMRQMRGGYRVWAKSEYLYWWAKGDELPPLVTTSPNNVAEEQIGVLGLPTTTILFGDDAVNEGPRDGGRLTMGYWFDEIQSEGIQADYLILETETTRYDASSDGSFRLARPFVNAVTLTENSNIIAANGITIDRAGAITIEDKSRFESAGIAWRHLIWTDCEPSYWYRLNFLFGYRYYQLNEGISINDIRALQTFPTVTLTGFDRFDTANRFHGGELGFSGEINTGKFSFGATGKIAMGNMHQILDIDGLLSENGLTTPGDLLTKPSNIGVWQFDDFAVIPEVMLDIGYRPTDWLRFSVGYSFIHLNRVLRPGTSIDLGVDFTQNLPRPAPQTGTTDFYLHGLSASAELKF